MVKVCKIELKPLGKEIGIENQLFYDILYKLRCEHRAAANRAIQLIWEQQNEDEKFKDIYGEYPTKEQRTEKTGYSTSGGLIYNSLKNEFTSLNTAVLSACQQLADKKMKNDRKDIFTGKKSIPNFNNTLPVEVPKRNIQFNYDVSSGGWSVELSLLSVICKKEIGLKKGILPFKCITKDRNIRSTLEKCIDGIYSVCGSKLKYDKKKNKYFLMLSFQFDIEKKQFDSDKICIVHLGDVNAVECTTIGDDKPLIINGNEIEHFISKNETIRKSKLRQRKVSGDGSVGHGTKKRIEAVYKNGNVVKNFKNTINHRYSKYIVEYAWRNKCGIIQLEDLSNISNNLLFLKDWAYFDLQNKIKNKADCYGINIIFAPYPKSDDELVEKSANSK